MKIKRLISLLLTLMLLAGTAPALAADAGSRQDPLLSHSFVDSWSSAVLSHAEATAHSAAQAALATLNIFESDAILEQNRWRAQKLADTLAPLAGHPQVRHLRQRGMILAFDVLTEDPRFNRRFYRAALDNEALLRPIGNTVYLMPPYIIDDAEIDHLSRAIHGALEATLIS